MNKRYAFTHPKIDGQVIFEYANGLLILYELDGAIEAAALHLMLLKLPIREDMLSQLSTHHEAKYVLIEQDLSFERFMQLYKHRPAGSSKKIAEHKWNKLSKADRQAAMKYIPAYDRELSRTSVAKKYPETYINQRIWDK